MNTFASNTLTSSEWIHESANSIAYQNHGRLFQIVKQNGKTRICELVHINGLDLKRYRFPDFENVLQAIIFLRERTFSDAQAEQTKWQRALADKFPLTHR